MCSVPTAPQSCCTYGTRKTDTGTMIVCANKSPYMCMSCPPPSPAPGSGAGCGVGQRHQPHLLQRHRPLPHAGERGGPRGTDTHAFGSTCTGHVHARARAQELIAACSTGQCLPNPALKGGPWSGFSWPCAAILHVLSLAPSPTRHTVSCATVAPNQHKHNPTHPSPTPTRPRLYVSAWASWASLPTSSSGSYGRWVAA